MPAQPELKEEIVEFIKGLQLIQAIDWLLNSQEANSRGLSGSLADQVAQLQAQGQIEQSVASQMLQGEGNTLFSSSEASENGVSPIQRQDLPDDIEQKMPQWIAHFKRISEQHDIDMDEFVAQMMNCENPRDLIPLLNLIQRVNAVRPDAITRVQTALEKVMEQVQSREKEHTGPGMFNLSKNAPKSKNHETGATTQGTPPNHKPSGPA